LFVFKGAQEGFAVLLDQKVTKNKVQQKGFFTAQGLCPANQAKPGLQNLDPLTFAQATASASIAIPLQPHCLPSFCLISPEAVLLTGKIKYEFLPGCMAGI
jgi:hypothetical protein